MSKASTSRQNGAKPVDIATEAFRLAKENYLASRDVFGYDFDTLYDLCRFNLEQQNKSKLLRQAARRQARK